MVAGNRKPRSDTRHRLLYETGRWEFCLDGPARQIGVVHPPSHKKRPGEPNLRQIAVEASLNYSHLLHIVNETKLVTPQILGRLCDYFRCQPSDLLRRVPNPVGAPPESRRKTAWSNTPAVLRIIPAAAEEIPVPAKASRIRRHEALRDATPEPPVTQVIADDGIISEW